MTRYSTIAASALRSLSIAGVLSSLITFDSGAAVPFTSATVTKVENRVSYGEIRGEQSVTRPAAVSDVVRANNYLRSEADSRAELQYPDGSLVRIGQSTVFSFDSGSRTFSLEKGSFLFYMPKGAGGGRIKTPSLTAAITGTVGKVSENIIAILEGEVTLVPSGRKVPAGWFARRNPDGTITIAKFDPKAAWEGKLINFNGLIPGLKAPPESGNPVVFQDQVLRDLETLHRTNDLPSAIRRFFPEPPSKRPKPESESENPTPVTPPPPPPPPPLRD